VKQNDRATGAVLVTVVAGALLLSASGSRLVEG
jgi:hypothetical protein